MIYVSENIWKKGALSLCLAAGLIACSNPSSYTSQAQDERTSSAAISSPVPDIAARDILTTYADIAFANYSDAFDAALILDAAIETLITRPSSANLQAARDAWVAARVPYQQTEVFRFGNPIVDAWEGRVNAWPLDEGLIDYVDATYGTASDGNAFYAVNVIAHETLNINGREIDAREITPTLLSETLHEAGAIEANVATGYHAIEFLLWGQDLNGTGPGAGTRPATDFDPAACTGGHCARRSAYLRAASTLLLTDLSEIIDHWSVDGAARAQLMDQPMAGLSAILTGIGSLSYGELAGERMKLGLLLRDPEEEHDCFSDNTHNSHFYNQVGMMNVYTGRYASGSGEIISGPSLAEYVERVAPELNADVNAKMQATYEAMSAMRVRAETIEAYDQMLGEGNTQGHAVLQAVIDALIAQTRPIERVVKQLQLDGTVFEGSESLDDPGAVFK